MFESHLHYSSARLQSGLLRSYKIICGLGSDLKYRNTEDIRLMEFMHLIFTRLPGESYRKQATQHFVVVLVLRISSTNLPGMLILKYRGKVN